MPFSFAAKAFGIAKCRPLRRGLPLRSMCGRNLRFSHTRSSLFCDTITVCDRNGPLLPQAGTWSRMALWAFSLPQISAPVPADLSLPGSKKAPERVLSFGLYHRLPQDSPSRIRAAERHTKALPYSLFTRPTPAFPSRFPGASASCSQQGGGGSVPRQQYGTAKHPFPPHVPACRAQAHSEPVPQSGTPQLFTFLYSLFTRPALPPFPSGTDSKTKIYFAFWSLDT